MNSSLPDQTQGEHYQDVRKVLWWVLAANLSVTLIKIILGLVTGALAIVADGFHSLVDSSSNLIGLAAIGMARRPADEAHPYGYRKYETIGAMGIGSMLLVAGWEITRAVIQRIQSGSNAKISSIMFAMIVLTIPINIGIVVLESRAGNKLKSAILLADAKHTSTDLYVTGSVVFSMVCVRLGWSWMDPVIASMVVLFILKAAFSILRDSMGLLTDIAVVNTQLIKRIAQEVPGVLDVHDVRSRGTNESAFVDLHLQVRPGLATAVSHELASKVEQKLKSDIPNVTEVLVHIEPYSSEGLTSWDRISLDLERIAEGLGVNYHDLHIHLGKNASYSIELHLVFKDDVILSDAHTIADEFEAQVIERWHQVESVVVHMEPLAEDVLLTKEQGDPPLAAEIRDVFSQRFDHIPLKDIHINKIGTYTHAAIWIGLPSKTLLRDVHTTAETVERELITKIPAIYRMHIHVDPE